MISVSKSTLPVNKPKPLTMEEIERRRAVARERHQERMAKTEEEVTLAELSSNITNSLKITTEDTQPEEEKEEEEDSKNDEVFIAFARVYSGTLRPGDKMYVLTPKHDPRKLE